MRRGDRYSASGAEHVGHKDRPSVDGLRGLCEQPLVIPREVQGVWGRHAPAGGYHATYIGDSAVSMMPGRSVHVAAGVSGPNSAGIEMRSTMFRNCRIRLKVSKDSQELEASGSVALLIGLSLILGAAFIAWAVVKYYFQSTA